MKIMKKVTALFLCAVMVMAMGITAFADNGKYTITVNNQTSGYSYTAYQVFKGTLQEIDGKQTLGDIKWSEEVNDGALLAALKNSTAFNTEKANDDGSTTTVNPFTACTTAAQVAEVVSTFTNDSAKAVAFADLVGKNVASNGGHAATYSDTNKNYTISGLSAGYYVVVNDNTPAGASASRYILQVVNNVSVTPKTETPDIDKKITDNDRNAAKDDSKKTNTAAIGDTINYEISGNLPDTTGYEYYYYVINDTLSVGLSLQENSFAVTVVDKNGNVQKTLVKDTDYYLYTQNTIKRADGTYTFQLAIKDMKSLYETYGSDAVLTVTYNAVVNSDAVVSGAANTNTAKLQYSNNPNKSETPKEPDKPGVPPENPGDEPKNPTGVTTEKITKTYVTELQLIKIDQDGNRLQGAEFTLTGTNLNQVKITTSTVFTKVEGNVAEGTTVYWKLNDGSYTTTDPSTVGIDKTKYASETDKYTKTTVTDTKGSGIEGKTDVKATVGEDGTITFTGLAEGTYKLTESHTPDGYNTADPIEFTIGASLTKDSSSNTEGGTITWSIDAKSGVTTDGNTFAVTVINNKGSVLPSTGGIGTTIFYVVGTVLVLGAAVVLIARKRMGSERA